MMAMLMSFSLVAAGCGNNSNNAASGDNKTLKVWFMGTSDTVDPIAKMYEEKILASKWMCKRSHGIPHMINC